MNKQTNYKFTIYLRFLGLVATTVQFVQFFNGKWNLETNYEILILILSVALALNPSKYLDKLIDAVVSRIKGKDNTTDFQAFNTGGSSIPPENEEKV